MNRFHAFVLMASWLFTGCASLHTVLAPHQEGENGRHCKSPARWMVMATAFPVTDGGERVQPGVLCRTYFFEGASPHPVTTGGSVRFVLYDLSKGDPEGRHPDGEYPVVAQQFESHRKRDIVGQTYIFWLPYSPSQKTTVVVQGVFTDAEGRTQVASEAVTLELEPVSSGQAHPEPGRGQWSINNRSQPIQTVRPETPNPSPQGN